MTDRFDDLVGGTEDLSAAQRDRLGRMHELLLEADAPTDVPAHLREAPVVEGPAPVAAPPRERRRSWLRVRPAAVLAAAALAVAAFAGGYLLGGDEPDAVAEIEMTGSGGTGSIELLPQDESGNWPMRVLIRGLEPSAGRQDYYELWLTRHGRLAESCGRFTLHEGQTTVTLSVPYGLRAYDGWVVTRRGSSKPLLTTA